MILQIDSLNVGINPSVIETTFTASNIIGWIVSSFICIILTVIIYPYLDEKFQAFVVRKFNFLHISTGHKIAGSWTHKWYVTSTNFPPINEIKNVQIKQFRKRIFAQYNVTDKNGKTYTYQMLGNVDKDQVITGVWRDIEQGYRYHGCFQIYIDINEQTMTGYWTGLSKEKNIKSDKWEWIRE
ncbi:MAG: hypothetical protein K0S23_2746 [Fluviicola sp.]|jgi:hypothetical protein|uniref:hypothetical protein n=1 Tax=Fluviicola sp. TaxID=1917219 RepID=UPI002602A589|nr:hypothetical protein [Fluviicola sp.]MDF3028439.1 hypothetical protein [Fluviicola sp.]